MPKMTITFSAPALYFGFLVSLVAFSGTIKGLPKVKAGGATKPRSSPFAKWRDSNPALDKTREDPHFGLNIKSLVSIKNKLQWEMSSFVHETSLKIRTKMRYRNDLINFRDIL